MSTINNNYYSYYGIENCTNPYKNNVIILPYTISQNEIESNQKDVDILNNITQVSHKYKKITTNNAEYAPIHILDTRFTDIWVYLLNNLHIYPNDYSFAIVI